MVAMGEKIGEVAKISKRFILERIIIRFKGEIPVKLGNFSVRVSSRGMELYIIIAWTSFCTRVASMPSRAVVRTD